jgi:sigma-E factor negative regulatory protein RseB
VIAQVAGLRRRAPLAGLGLALSLALAASSALAGPADARAWLERMRSAANTGNYQGTMVFTAGGAMSSTRVWHYCVGEQTYERLEAQDGRQQRIYRHNDEVRTLWPQSRVAVAERRETLTSISTTPQAVDPRALEHYEFRREGEARVAGREAAVFLLEPRDGLRFAQRLWADKATGLMLRADVLDAGRAVLETASFSEIEWGVKPQPEMVTQAMRALDAKAEAKPDPRAEPKDGWRVLRPPQRRTQLEAEGWTLREKVPGFQLAGCVVRGLVSAGEELSVLQAVFSDGLTHVSLFVEPFRAERHRVAAQSQLGATSTVTRRLGEHWITVVGDVPATTLRQFAESLERRR